MVINKNISRMNPVLRREDVAFGDVVYVPGGECGPRMQRDYQLVIIYRGSLELLLDGRNIAVAPGQAILLTPGHREHFIFARDTETHHGWCAIKPAAIPAKMRRILASAREPAPFVSHLATLLKFGEASVSVPPAIEDLGNAYSLSLGLALLYGFAAEARAGNTVRDSADEARSRLDDFVSREYEKPLKLAQLAKAAGVSRQHLMKLFRERGWPTPTGYLYEKRLETATDLLSHTGLSIGEIALRCGFANAFHFSRKFRKARGKSPRSWRMLAWAAGK